MRTPLPPPPALHIPYTESRRPHIAHCKHLSLEAIKSIVAELSVTSSKLNRRHDDEDEPRMAPARRRGGTHHPENKLTPLSRKSSSARHSSARSPSIVYITPSVVEHRRPARARRRPGRTSSSRSAPISPSERSVHTMPLNIVVPL